MWKKGLKLDAVPKCTMEINNIQEWNEYIISQSETKTIWLALDRERLKVVNWAHRLFSAC